MDKMTEEIYRHDGYMFEFESRVVSKNDDLVELESTAFYPGGGGQVCDTGMIRGEIVTEVFQENGKVLHRVPGNNLKIGDAVWCSVDWDRRYDLMKGHTGEHLLFCALKRQDPELSICKIYISPESKYVIVNHDLDWEKIEKAVRFANDAIRENLPVTRTMMSRDDPDIANVRIKLERINEDEISVVSIGNIDMSACSGIHVMETSELEFLFVDRKVSAGKDGVAIHFKIGDAAKDSAIGLSNLCLRIAEECGSDPNLLISTIHNMKEESERSKNIIKTLSKKQLETLKPIYGKDGTPIYSGIFEADKKTLTDSIEKYRSTGGVVALISSTDRISIMIASGTKKLNCKNVLTSVLNEFDGRGGGREDFAQGGIDDVSRSDDVLKRIQETILSTLQI